MSVKIRLQRRGRRKKPFYHIVVADARAPRDGRFIEKLGTYNPMTSPATIELDRDRTFDWIMKGAQPTDTARAILKFQGVLYRKHLQRGVIKGALSQEQADEQYQAWVSDKDSQIRARHQAAAEERAAWHKKLSGTAKPIVAKVVEIPEDEVATEGTEEASAEEPAEMTEEAPVAEVAEDAPATEAEVETPVAETTEEVEATDETATEESPEEAEASAEEVTEETPAEEVVEETPAEEAAEETPAEETAEETPAEETAEETPAEETAEETPAEEAATDSGEGTTEENAEEATTEDDTSEVKD